MDIKALYDIYLRNLSVQTDTRRLQKGDIFFALKGPNFNGNAFAEKSIEAGAALAVIDEPKYEIPGKTFLVEDVLAALQQLAQHHRKQFQIPFIAITGSNGKTTTKELIHAVLSTSYKTYTTQGNLNNHIGVPLTLLKIRQDAEMAVIEMGANHLQEIAAYCKIAMPTHGLITNCGKAHLKGFGSEEGVKKGKGELFDFLREQPDGTAFIMNDYDYLLTMSRGIDHIITYGTTKADVTGNIINAADFLSVQVNIEGAITEIHTKLIGDYNLPNILAAVAVGKDMQVPVEKIKQALENYIPSNSRSQLIEAGSNKFILDAYNANPSSMKLAIENFARMPDPHKILMLGAMAEMGAATQAEHQRLIDLIAQHTWDDVVLVGAAFAAYKDQYRFFNTADEAGDWLKQQHFNDTRFLIKGSRSTQMEKILQAVGVSL